MAKALCQYAHGAQHIIELSADTGAVTRYLRDAFPDTMLVVVEWDTRMAAALQQRFVSCLVVPDAVQIRKDLFKGTPDQSVKVSSSPFRSLPETVATSVVALLRDF
ncbi:MAG: hypothetical protein H7240_00360 [Glaciimonas sp.]|nr:hypothetical protein [Glaciimonas sp.]